MRERRRMRGGKLLGEGSYGCAFDEIPTCDIVDEKLATNADETVGKFFDDDYYLQKEWMFARILSTIDPHQKYFLYTTSKCVIDVAKLKKINGIKTCRHLPHILDRVPTSQVGMLKMPNGGIALNKAILEKKIAFKPFLRAIYYILDGIKLLHKAGFIHSDIKYDNIVFNTATADIRIIDFGMMIHKTDAFDSTKNHAMQANHWMTPPELTLLFHISSMKEEHHVKTQFIEYIQSLHWRLTEDKTLLQLFVEWVWPIREWEKAYFQVAKHYMEHTKIRRYAHAIDVYGFGLNLFIYIQHFYMSRDKVPQSIIDCIRGMTHPNPAKRWTIDKVKRHFAEKILI